MLFVGGTFLVLPPYSGYCKGDQANNYYCTGYEVAVVLGRFADDHGNGVIALATLALFIATVGLWWSTNRSAKISERALTELEVPEIFVRFDDVGIGRKVGNKFTGTLQYRFINYGRVPAIIRRAEFLPRVVRRGTGLPPVGADVSNAWDLGYGFVVPPHGGVSDPIKFDFEEFTARNEEGDTLLNADYTVFVSIAARYSYPPDNLFDVGFCFGFDDAAGEFSMSLLAGETHNYKRRVKQ